MKLPIYALLGITTLGFACGSDDGEKIETSQVHAIVAQNSENAVNTTLNNAAFLENSDLIEKIFGATGETCFPVADGSPDTQPNCQARKLDLNFGELRLKRSEISDLLKQTVFQSGNVESSTETEITYLIAGESVCGTADPMFPSNCIADVNKAQIRLRITSPEPDAVDIDVLVGPSRDNPISLEFHSDLLALEADLDGFEGAVGYLESQNLISDEISLPTTFDGRLRAEVKIEGRKKISSSISVLRAINVSGGDFGLQVGANEPTFKVTLDGVAKTLTLLADVGQTQVRFLENDKIMELNLAGIDGEAVLSAGSDSIAFTGLGYGDAQSTLSIDGKQAFSFDLNADSGRHINLIASPDKDGVKLDFLESVEVALGLSLDDDEAPDFLQDDVLNISLTGDNPSLIVKDGDIVEILAGTLKLSLEKAGQSIEATAGKCVTQINDVAVGPDQGNDVSVDTNIIEDMSVGACE